MCARLAPGRSWPRGPTASATGATPSAARPTSCPDRADAAQRDPRPGQLVPLAAASTPRRTSVTVELRPAAAARVPVAAAPAHHLVASAPDGLRADARARPTSARDAGPVRLGASTRTCWCPACAVDDLTLTVPGPQPAAGRRRGCCRSARPGSPAASSTSPSPRRIGAAVLDTAFGDVIRDADGGSAVDPRRRRTARARRGLGRRGVRLVAGLHRRHAARRPAAAGRVAIEPMTCPPDAFRSGRDLITLEPGADLARHAGAVRRDGWSRPMEFRDVVRRRRMVRNYDPDRPVPPEIVERLLEHAIRAPVGRVLAGLGLPGAGARRTTGRGSGRPTTPPDGRAGSTGWPTCARAPLIIVPHSNKAPTWTATPSRTRAGPTATRPAGRCRTGTSTPASPAC